MGMNLKLIHSKDYHNLLNDIIENELSATPPNNEVLWVAMGNELEIEGVEKTQISTIIRKDIEDQLYEKQFKEYMPREEWRYHSGHYWRVMKKNGWTNPYMARHVSNDNVDPSEGSNNSSINTQNTGMIELCYDIINVCRTIRDKSKECKAFENIFGEKQMSEFYHQLHAMIDNCKSGLDDKTKVPVNTELILLECVSTIIGSISTCVKKFMEIRINHMEEQGKFLTLKQLTKFQKGNKQSQLELFKPLTRDTAVFLKYFGIQCVCGSWRVRSKQDGNDLECYDCDKIIPKTHISKCEHCQIPLYKERLLWMIKHNNRCQNCNIKNDLPQELVYYANS